MTQGHPVEERREKCDDCVKSDFGTVKKLVFLILGAVILSNGYIQYAGADQQTRIKLLENAVVELKTMAEQNTVEHEQFRKDRDEQTKIIVDAVTRAIKEAK